MADSEYGFTYSSPDRKEICGIICNCGPNGEPLACGYKHDREGNHSWATLPTWRAHPDERLKEIEAAMKDWQVTGDYESWHSCVSDVDVEFLLETIRPLLLKGNSDAVTRNE